MKLLREFRILLYRQICRQLLIVIRVLFNCSSLSALKFNAVDLFVVLKQWWCSLLFIFWLNSLRSLCWNDDLRFPLYKKVHNCKDLRPRLYHLSVSERLWGSFSVSFSEIPVTISRPVHLQSVSLFSGSLINPGACVIIRIN